jgi:D-glycero-D-manno-heptose 1,7-bisphosphate phosphatase
VRPAVFMDRDGVLIENVHNYVRRWEDVEYFDQAFRALKRLHESPYALIVITNQSVIGRGILPKDHVESLNRRILEGFEEQGVVFDGVYMCPHSPDDDCDCRKPKPGMLVSAAHDLGLDLASSYMVGDALTDMQAADAAGVQGILVRSGRGIQAETQIGPNPKWPVVDDLDGAVSLILGG